MGEGPPPEGGCKDRQDGRGQQPVPAPEFSYAERHQMAWFLRALRSGAAIGPMPALSRPGERV